MKKSYQTVWQNIQFSDFSRPSSTKLAGAEFYQAFYEEFFRRYRNWEELPASWRKEKERWAEFVLDRDRLKVLSVGCGLGTMEHYIHSKNNKIELFIHEVAPSAWRWIATEFAEEHKFSGMIPVCLPDGVQFDLIYLATVDYVFDDDTLVGLLAALRPFLSSSGGQCMLISATLPATPVTLKEKAVSHARELRTWVEAALDGCGLRSRGQFWGWIRTQNEYQALMRRAGYRDIEDGFINHHPAHYWIAGRAANQ